VLNVVDGCIPSDMATGTADEIEEERRLLYVAMTRAKEHLALLVPQRFYVTQQSARGDRHLYGARSRFVTPQVAALFDDLGPAPSKADERPQMHQQVDVQAAVRAAW
jgi:DNA helicase-2/ATP-dependent DNA helicase PcrA